MWKRKLLRNNHNCTRGNKSCSETTTIAHPSSSLALLCFQIQHIKPSAQVRAYDAGEVFELLNTHDQDFTLNNLLEIRKQKALEESEEPESEPQERTMRVSRLSVGNGPIETDIRLLEGIYVNVQRAATTRKEITMKLASYWEI
jgi:hypothetical protein